MTNEQMWVQWEMFRTILKLSKNKEQAEAEIDRIMEATRTNLPRGQEKQ